MSKHWPAYILFLLPSLACANMNCVSKKEHRLLQGYPEKTTHAEKNQIKTRYLHLSEV